LLQFTKASHGAADVVEPLRAFRYQAGDWPVVPRNHNLFALGYTIQQLSEVGLGLERTDFGHRASNELTSR
jgi:hypothetical protein